MSFGASQMRIRIGDKEVKDYVSPESYQLVDEGEGQVFAVQDATTALMALRKAGEQCSVVPVI